MPDQDNLGRKILGFFIKPEDAAPAQPGPRPAAGPLPQAAGAPAPAAPLPPGSVDSKFAQHFADVLAKNNPPGPDYFEFREALRSLGSLGLSEEKQYQAAWASFKALGGTADVSVLTHTANQYLNVLGQDRDGFIQSVDAAIKERVGGLQQEQQRLRSENEALAQQLQEIQQKMAANTERLTAMDGEITAQSTKLQQNRQNYEATYTVFTQQIKDDLNKLTHYLR
jgi:FtsZ-binding cell division protein ZapB